MITEKNMAKPKFYAVRRGRKTGIFENWDECREHVSGFAGAEYKSFASRTEAEAFLAEEASDGEEASESGVKVEKPKKKRMTAKEKEEYYKSVAESLVNEVPKGRMLAYTDGSYDEKSKRYSCGCVMITKEGVFTYSSAGSVPEAVPERNVAGELTAAMYAVKKAASSGIGSIVIYHDYYGVSKWFKKEWKARSFCSLRYLDFMEKYRSQMDISFVKVAGHTGDPLNEYADILAKAAFEEA